MYEVTIGIPSPEKRTTVGGILAVIVANIVGVALAQVAKDCRQQLFRLVHERGIPWLQPPCCSLPCLPVLACVMEASSHVCLACMQVVALFVFTAFNDEDAEDTEENLKQD